MEDSSKQAYKWKKKVGGWGEWVDILILPSEIRGGWQPPVGTIRMQPYHYTNDMAGNRTHYFQ